MKRHRFPGLYSRFIRGSRDQQRRLAVTGELDVHIHIDDVGFLLRIRHDCPKRLQQLRDCDLPDIRRVVVHITPLEHPVLVGVRPNRKVNARRAAAERIRHFAHCGIGDAA